MSETDCGRQALWRGGGHAPSPGCVSWEQKLGGVVRRGVILLDGNGKRTPEARARGRKTGGDMGEGPAATPADGARVLMSSPAAAGPAGQQ